MKHATGGEAVAHAAGAFREAARMHKKAVRYHRKAAKECMQKYREVTEAGRATEAKKTGGEN